MRKVLLPAALLVTVFATSAASCDETVTTVVEAVTPAQVEDVRVQTTCSSITVTTAGWPQGSTVNVFTDGQPNFGQIINTTYTFPVPIMAPAGDDVYGWSVFVSVPGEVQVRQFHGSQAGCVPWVRPG